ncbi:MAG TPA: nuclear transport factor 2 family protein [Mycobacteriales bacterium]|jgi:ketosteroid isomerase-like protein|nr:nuclear transport factor 2 family protein [Mycobacteriales bacterium]
MTTATRASATTYFEAWRDKDFDKLRTVLAENVSFRGPMGTADGIDDCVQGIQQMAAHTIDIDVHVMAVDGEDVITFYDLQMDGVEPVPTANWSHVEAGRITAIRATFDPRPLLAAADR